MKLGKQLLLVAMFVSIMIGSLRPLCATETAPPDLQEQIRQLKEKLDNLEEILKDPEGTVQSTATSVKKIQKIQISGYLQTRFEAFQNSKNGTSTVDRFAVRRARLSIGARPSDDLAIKVSTELAGGVVLKDAFLTWYPWHSPETGPSLTIGQMNWCFGYEVPTSSSVRETPERALFSRKLFEGERDTGIKVSSAKGRPLEWEVGLFNGTGINKSDVNSAKDVVGRVRFQPTPTFDLAISGYFGEGFDVATPTVPARSWVKNRYGADAQWTLNGVTFKTEWVTAKERGRKPSGWLAQANWNIGKKNVLVVRFDTYNDKGADKFGRIDTWNAGIIRYLDPNLRVKLFHEVPKEERNRFKNNVTRVEFIAVF